MVESLNESKEFGEKVSLINFLVELVNGYQDVDKDSHDVRENSNSKQQDEHSDYSLSVTLWVEVSKPNSRQRRK
jgi:hypothetical protein